MNLDGLPVEEVLSAHVAGRGGILARLFLRRDVGLSEDDQDEEDGVKGVAALVGHARLPKLAMQLDLRRRQLLRIEPVAPHQRHPHLPKKPLKHRRPPVV
jgi:hypothetical protein